MKAPKVVSSLGNSPTELEESDHEVVGVLGEEPAEQYDFYGSLLKEPLSPPPKKKVYRSGTMTFVGQRERQGVRILKILDDTE